MRHQIEIPQTVIKSDVIVRLADVLARKQPSFNWYQDTCYLVTVVTVKRWYDIPSLDFLSTLERYAVYLSCYEGLTIQLSHIDAANVQLIVEKFNDFYSK